MKYRDIQPTHEKSVLTSFSSYLSSQGISMEVTSRPDPPDAFVTFNNKPCWVEITDAFQSRDWAKDITSYAADDKPHAQYERTLIIEPDQIACDKVRTVIIKKYDKKTIKDIYRNYGQGILLVGLYTPLTRAEEIIEQCSKSILSEIAKKEPVFKSIYLYENDHNGHIFTKFL